MRWRSISTALGMAGTVVLYGSAPLWGYGGNTAHVVLGLCGMGVCLLLVLWGNRWIG